MSNALDNFNKWFKNPLSLLYTNIDAGFIVVMISISLLERYLREKTGIYENKLDHRFYDEFIKIFPSVKTINDARIFWEVSRHGLLHQSTFKLGTRKGDIICTVGLHNDANDILCDYKQKGIKIVIPPIKFSKIIISTIENDFSNFKGKGSPLHPRSEVFNDWDLGYFGASGVEK